MNLVVVLEDFWKKDNPPHRREVVNRQKQTYHQKERDAQNKCKEHLRNREEYYSGTPL